MGIESADRPTFDERRVGPLRAAVGDTVRSWDGVEPGTTLGCPAFLADGAPFAVVTDDGLALCGLDDDARNRLRLRWSALALDPRPWSVGGEDGALRSDGGETASWPVVPVGGNDLVFLRRFLRLSYEGVRAGQD
jgi:hypothetical protein